MVKMFVVYDSKAEVFNQPFYCRTTGEATRSFIDECNRKDGNSAVAKHPEDYTLFEIGQYDELSGNITMYEAKKSLGVAVNFVRPDNPAPHIQAI